jgi:hypothetical protein
MFCAVAVQWLALNALLHTFPAMMLDCRDAVLGGKGGNRRKMAKISQVLVPTCVIYVHNVKTTKAML